MAKVAIGPDWKRVDSDLGLAATTKYRLQFESHTQIVDRRGILTPYRG